MKAIPKRVLRAQAATRAKLRDKLRKLAKKAKREFDAAETAYWVKQHAEWKAGYNKAYWADVEAEFWEDMGLINIENDICNQAAIDHDCLEAYA